MFGDMLGNIEQQQQELAEKLSHIKVGASIEDGAIQVSANGNKEITNIAIDSSKLDIQDSEQLEDLLLEVINRALELAGEQADQQSQSLIKDMLPPGLGNLFGG